MVDLAHRYVPCTGAADAPLFVLLHGLTSAGATFWNVQDALAATARVLLVDLRGHGGSPEAEDLDYRLAPMAEDVHRLLTKPGTPFCLAAGESFHLLGHSWGSRVAFQYAEAYAATVKTLLVEDEFVDSDKPAVRPDDDDEAKIMSKAAGFAGQYRPVFPTWDAALAFYNATHGTESGVDYTRKVITNNATGECTVLFKPHVACVWDYHCRVADMNHVWTDCERFSFPILILKGGDDSSDIDAAMLAKLEEEAVRMAAAGGRRAVQVIAGAAHAVHRTHPDEFVAACVAFHAAA
eukprot:TRINITY_DN6537_c0_g1_i1.p1 TRINITY_DN6537_c0_g1~~TRINITY_DN6537_c0_g1_i1.p1  ORF type:complete len:294 (+),score=102.34 TRINITY_DN6537_c0_g1_i1:61-942(+)